MLCVVPMDCYILRHKVNKQKVNYSSSHTRQQYVWNVILVHNASCHVHFQLGKNKAPPKRQAEASE